MKFLKSFVPFIILLFLWTILSNKVNPLFLPKINKVIEDVFTLTANGTLINSIFKSFMRITIATSISCLISIPLALMVYNFKTMDQLISPLTNMLRYVPVTAFSPLLILWIGINENMKISFLFCATFFYFLPTIVLNIKSIDKRLIDTGKTMGMSKIKILTDIVVPYTLPSICESILMMYGIGWSYIVIAEATNCTSGLGYLINIGSARGRTDMVFMAIIIIMIISFIVDTIGKLLIRKVFKWKFKESGEE